MPLVFRASLGPVVARFHDRATNIGAVGRPRRTAARSEDLPEQCFRRIRGAPRTALSRGAVYGRRSPLLFSVVSQVRLPAGRYFVV